MPSRKRRKLTDLGRIITGNIGGRGGIRTHEGRKPLPVFKTGAFNRSATRPLKTPLKPGGDVVSIYQILWTAAQDYP